MNLSKATRGKMTDLAQFRKALDPLDPLFAAAINKLDIMRYIEHENYRNVRTSFSITHTNS